MERAPAATSRRALPPRGDRDPSSRRGQARIVTVRLWYRGWGGVEMCGRQRTPEREGRGFHMDGSPPEWKGSVLFRCIASLHVSLHPFQNLDGNVHRSTSHDRELFVSALDSGQPDSWKIRSSLLLSPKNSTSGPNTKLKVESLRCGTLI